MIEYCNITQSGEILCDFCTEYSSYDGAFQKIVDCAKADGWEITFNNQDSDFEHKCPACVEEENDMGDFI